MYNETVKLVNGVDVPRLALGTWLIDDDKAADAVRAAIKLGYRHIDTAQAYGNEKGVGEGVRASGVDRKEIFITSKVAAEHKTYEEAAAGINKTLATMGLDYIDMMIIHSPQPWTEVNQSDNRYIEGNREAWRALEDAYKAGRIRAIGVSNFIREDIDNLWEGCEIKPMVNQVLCHISNTPLDLIEYCQSKGIIMEAYSPVAHGEAMKNEKIAEMADKYGVSIPQLCIRYDIQLGMVVLPKTANLEHMKTNADVDFVISDEDMELLKDVEKIESYGEHGFFPVFGGRL
ncbi:MULTISPECIES: aldo/keto reductase [Mogibacterium]|uniref:Aldo/keto reductase n=1 Tax=Mogibacterium timidum TaxID=35519 RepID=A0A7Y8VRC3_9FIRM|nr:MULTISPECIES: aldo/keto reductase [Mogibacterium]NWO23249.1 aldo/keto reductase [Mogibacterium timidum]